MAGIKDGSNERYPLLKLKRLHFWPQLALNLVFVLFGQAAAIILGKIYYEKGGNSKWLATLVQTAGFPILLIPYYFLVIPCPKEQSDSSNQKQPLPLPWPSNIKVTIIYFLLGALIAGDNMLYSIALLYLSASTYSLVCATQLVFNAIFSFFVNGKKFTSLIFNSVINLTLAAALLAINEEDSDKPSGITRSKYIIGIIAATVASVLYSLILPLMQHSFQKVIKKETFSVVLEMQIYTSLVATGISTIGLFASGEWRTLSGEMQAFTTGKAAYVQVLVWTAVGWQIAAVGVVGLIFVVSSLFSNVISTLSLAVTPIALVIILHDKMNAVEMNALLMAMWGFGSYIYQNYLDDIKVRQVPPLLKFKLVILGDESVGKSSIITRFVYNKFNKNYEPTFGIDFLSKTVYLEDRKVRLEFWDASAQKKFRGLIPRYTRDSAIAAVVYDVTSRQSFLNTSEWIEKVRADHESYVIIVLVGTKTDLVEKRQVSKKDGEAKARELNVMFIETSAKAGLNIEPLFRKIAAALRGGRYYHAESYMFYCQIVFPHFYSTMRQTKNMIFSSFGFQKKCVHAPMICERE